LTERIKINNQLILILIERSENSNQSSLTERIENSDQLLSAKKLRRVINYYLKKIEKSDQLLLKKRIEKSNQLLLIEKNKNND